jgi:uncharacterized protein YceK
LATTALPLALLAAGPVAGHAAVDTITAAPGASAATEKTLYAFPSTGANGCHPVGTLLQDGAGALYGESYYCGAGGYGTVFKLVPPLPGQTAWSISVLYAFNGGAELPGSLVMDAHGALYGATRENGPYGEGIVFRLNPPARGGTTWTETILHAFDYSLAYNQADGSQPHAGVIMDANGALYGTTYYGGTLADPYAYGFGVVFQLTPPLAGQTTWKETVLYRFKGGVDGQNPSALLTRDGSGALYGTTFLGGRGQCADLFGSVVGCGTVFKLTPPAPGQTNWTKATLHGFAGGVADGANPLGKLLLDESGALYGTTPYGGQGQCADDAGSILGCGTVFKLTPPPPGQTAWTETVVYKFKGVPDGEIPEGGLIADPAGNLYSATLWGGNGVCPDKVYRIVGCGTVYKLTPPALGLTAWTETVLHKFQAASPGGSKPVGGELVGNPRGNLFSATELGGTSLGYGTVFEITP